MNEYNHICVNSYCAFMAINLFEKKNIAERKKQQQRRENKNK